MIQKVYWLAGESKSLFCPWMLTLVWSRSIDEAKPMVRWGLGQSAQCIVSEGIKDAPNSDCWKCTFPARWKKSMIADFPRIETLCLWMNRLYYIILHVFENTWILLWSLMHVRVASCKLRGEVFWNGQGFGRHFWPWCLPLVLVALGSLHDFNWSLQSQPSCCGTQLRQRRSAWKEGEHSEVTGSDSALALVTSGVEICRSCLMMIRMQQKDVRIFWNVSILRIKPPIQLCFLTPNAKSIGLGCLEGNEVNDQCNRRKNLAFSGSFRWG